MVSFVDRYCRGEHHQVWDELMRLGDQVRQEPLFTDARAVAHETMRRARENLTRLIPLLQDVGYEFAYQPEPKKRIRCWWGDSYPVYAPPLADAAARLDELERKLGPMPLSLRAWYEVVGSVNFIGRHKGWPDTEVLDPLVVGPLEEMLDCIEDEHRDWREAKAEAGDRAVPFTWAIAPDALHKANISGGMSYGVEYPSPDADACLWFEWHDTTFVNYLRTAFQWGGFPGFQRSDEHDRSAGALRVLTERLLPL